MPAADAVGQPRAAASAAATAALAADRGEVLKPGALVRIQGLRDAAHLNGTLGTVVRYAREKSRYEVQLQGDSRPSALKSISPHHLETLDMSQEVQIHNEYLCRREVKPSEVRPVLHRLSLMPINYEVLAKTGIGKTVNLLSKKMADHDSVSEAAKQLVKRWREMYKAQADEKARQQQTAQSTGGLNGASKLNADPRQKGASAAAVTGGSSGAGRPPAKSQGQGTETLARTGGEDADQQTLQQVSWRDIHAPDRCMARRWNQGRGGQCTHRSMMMLGTGPHDLCAQHQSLLEQKGELPHGRIDGEIPESKVGEFKKALECDATPGSTSSVAAPAPGAAAESLGAGGSSVGSGAPAPAPAVAKGVPDVPPASSMKDAERLAEAMKNAPSERMRIGLLHALSRTPAEFFPAIASAGALRVLDKLWKASPECRSTIIVCCKKIDNVGKELNESGLVTTLSSALVTATAKPNVSKGSKDEIIEEFIPDLVTILDKWGKQGHPEPRMKERPSDAIAPTVKPAPQKPATAKEAASSVVVGASAQTPRPAAAAAAATAPATAPAVVSPAVFAQQPAPKAVATAPALASAHKHSSSGQPAGQALKRPVSESRPSAEGRPARSPPQGRQDVASATPGTVPAPVLTAGPDTGSAPVPQPAPSTAPAPVLNAGLGTAPALASSVGAGSASASPPTVAGDAASSMRSSAGGGPASTPAKPLQSSTPSNMEALLTAAAKEAEKAAAAAAAAKATAAAAQKGSQAAPATGEARASKKRQRAEEQQEVDLAATPAVGELAALDPRIAGMLKDRPEIMKFLTKHPQVLKNMNADGISFLTRNLRNCKKPKTNKEHGLESGRTLVLQNLHPNATEREVVELLEMSDLSPVEVTIPRESRKQRSVGVAYAVLRSTAAARSALRVLQGATLRGVELHVEFLDGKRSVAMPEPVDLEFVDIDPEEAATQDRPAHNRHVKWKSDEELWDVALYDRNESVAEFGSKILSHSQVLEAGLALTHGDSAQFQAAAKSEREEERKLVREALAHQRD